jgi:hypothetical protein
VLGNTRRLQFEEWSIDLVELVVTEHVVPAGSAMCEDDRLPRMNVVEAVLGNDIIAVRLCRRQIDDPALRLREVLERVSFDQGRCGAKPDAAAVIVGKVAALDSYVGRLPLGG